jgi:hypothetical protein
VRLVVDVFQESVQSPQLGKNREVGFRRHMLAKPTLGR